MNTSFIKSSGYSLIEVMVAVVVLSIGLAALGLLQVSNIQNTHNAHNHSLAMAAAHDMADRMRSNMDAYETAFFASTGSTGSDHNCDKGADCTPTQMAEHDILRWNEYLSANLPDGIGVVCQDSVDLEDGNPGNSWNCNGNGATVVKVAWRTNAAFSSRSDDDVINEWQSIGLLVHP